MRIVPKLTVAFVSGLVVALGAFAAIEARREVRLFESDMIQDHREMGRVLAATISDTWKNEGETRARELLERAYPAGPVKLKWVWLDEGPPSIASLHGTTDVVVRTADELDTFVRVTVPGARPGAVEISEPLTDERRYVRTTIVHAVLTTGATALLCAVLASILGTWIVGRPMSELVAMARRVGTGDLEGRIARPGRDEVGVLAEEMNLMASRLVDANVRVTHETAERITALEQLRHADRLATVGKLAAGIAHELGTPMNVISLSARMIVSGELAGKDAQDAAGKIAAQTDRMTAIIRQLLDFARRKESKFSPTPLGAIARQTLSLLEPLATKRRVRLALEETAPVISPVDPGLIQQSLANLVVNGIQASHGNGVVTVRIGRENATPPPGEEGKPGEWALIAVEDTGDGIPPELLPHVFEPFVTTKAIGEGTGLGLSVTHGIIRDHGGWITAESERGKGSRFRVHLPLAAAEEPAS